MLELYAWARPIISVVVDGLLGLLILGILIGLLLKLWDDDGPNYEHELQQIRDELQGLSNGLGDLAEAIRTLRSTHAQDLEADEILCRFDRIWD